MTKTTTSEGIGYLGRQLRSYAYYARIRVICRPANQQTDIVEFAPAVNFNTEWKAAAILGAELGLMIANDFRRCCITEANANPDHTSPFSIFVATMQAVWNAVGFVPPESYNFAIGRLCSWLRAYRDEPHSRFSAASV